MADSLTGVVTRSRLAAHRQVDGQAIIVLPRTGEAMVLNSTGAVVWELSDGTRTVDAVAQELAEQFGVPVETTRPDVERLYRELIAAGAAEHRP